MLVLSRVEGDQIAILPADDIDPATTVGDLFANGPIEISLYSASKHNVKMGVDAPGALSVVRKRTVAA
tara:strand:- start:157 stop:360 length:204 start_codon:yes stop_codon:yes gene_type:complete